VKKDAGHIISADTVRGLFEQSFLGVTIHRGFDILYSNGKVAQLLGYKNADDLRRCGDLLPHIPKRRHREVSERWQAIEKGDIHPERNRVSNITLGGNEIWLDITDERIIWEDGAPAIMSTLYDVSAAVRTNEGLLSSLRHLEVSLDSILETIPTGIAIFSDIGEPQTVNSEMRMMFQASPNANDYVPRAMADLLGRLVDSKAKEMTSRGVPTRMDRVVDLVARRMSDDTIMMCASDVSDWKSTQDKLKTLAERDTLTQLLNRRGFVDTVRPLLRSNIEDAKHFSILVVDIDYFKKINDTHGHAAGDEVLKSFANRLSTALRTLDVIGRIGGEEFAVFLPNTDTEIASRVAERLREKIAERPITFQEIQVSLTASFGLKVWEGNDKPRLRDLLRDADSALYRSKEAGRNKVTLA